MVSDPTDYSLVFIIFFLPVFLPFLCRSMLIADDLPSPVFIFSRQNRI